MATHRVYRKAIKRANELVGGPYRLAAELEVRVENILHWLEDRGEPDDTSFARAVDIILSHDGSLPWTAAELQAELLLRQSKGPPKP